MPNKLDKVSTGMKDLDADLRELFDVCKDKDRLDAIKQAIANEDISSEDFSRIVPKSLITFSFYLTGASFTLLLDRIKDEAVDLVKKAKSLIDEHFGNLSENKNAKAVLKEEMATGIGGAESITDEAIDSISYYLIWEDNPPELTPAVRVAFKNRKEKVLLNTRLDWGEFSFLLKSFSGILTELLKNGKSLAELGQLDLSLSQKVAKNVEKTSANLKKMKEFMPAYESNTETDNNEQSAKKITE